MFELKIMGEGKIKDVKVWEEIKAIIDEQFTANAKKERFFEVNDDYTIEIMIKDEKVKSIKVYIH